MDIRSKFSFHRTDIWREGVWIDLWSVVHILSGTVVGFCLYLFHFDAVVSAVLALVAFTGYELWEAMEQIEEFLTNRFSDVVCGMAGYLFVMYILAPYVSRVLFFVSFAVLFVVDIVMSTYGWRASQKAADLEKRLRAKYERQRAWFTKHGGRLKERYMPRKKVSGSDRENS